MTEKAPSSLDEPKIESFRWAASARSSDRCGPYQLARNLGLTALSPVTVDLTPLNEIQFRCEANTLPEFLSANSIAEYWQLDKGYIGFKEKTFMRLFDYRVGEHWEPMFLPNGEGTIEWRLGYDLVLPDGIGLLVCPPSNGVNFMIPYGYIAPQVAARTIQRFGFSIALKPLQPIRIERGAPIAKLIPIPLESLRTCYSFQDLVA